MALTVDNVLDELVQVNDFGPEITVREYVGRLALMVWELEEGFNGKRPFGNSSWQNLDVCYPIAERHGLDENEGPGIVNALITEALSNQAGKYNY